jgi:hypothetical protein
MGLIALSLGRGKARCCVCVAGSRRRRGCEGGKELRTVLRTRSEHGAADRWADLWMARAAGGLFIPWAMDHGPWTMATARRAEEELDVGCGTPLL